MLGNGFIGSKALTPLFMASLITADFHLLNYLTMVIRNEIVIQVQHPPSMEGF